MEPCRRRLGERIKQKWHDKKEATSFHSAKVRISQLNFMHCLVFCHCLRDTLNKSVKRFNNILFSAHSVVIQSGEAFGKEEQRSNTLDETVICLSLDTLRERLKDVHPTIYFPLVEEQ